MSTNKKGVLELETNVHIVDIKPAWTTCKYALRVWVKHDNWSIESANYALKMLRRLFGEAEFLWDDCYVVLKK